MHHVNNSLWLQYYYFHLMTDFRVITVILGPVSMVRDLLMEPMEEPLPLPAILPNPSGKYVSFANDDQFHHYPPENENEFLIGSYGSSGGGLGDRARDFEDDDPTLNPFVPSTSHALNAFGGGSVQSSCSSFSNLSGFDEPSTSRGKTHPGTVSRKLDMIIDDILMKCV